MRRIFGRQPTTAPPGTFRAIHFPMLGHLDRGTREGMISRQLDSKTLSARDLPRSGFIQFQQDVGHFGSTAAYALHEITVDPDTGEFSGKGWLADNEAGHATEIAVLSKSLFHNSVDLGDMMDSDIEIVMHGDFFDDDFYAEVIFHNANVIATTLVGKEAFAGSHAELPGEITAALGSDEPLVVDCESIFTANTALEVYASMSTPPSWDHFNRPEPDIPHPIVVDEPDVAGWIPIYGNLAQWRKKHRDAMGVLRHPPRGYDNYANFMKPKAVLTDNGFVPAGPITLLGGHVSLKDAVERVENVWADVRVIDGKHGPWICGVMRPHIAADAIETYRARASQISGYWSGGVLRLISSIVAPGYPVTGDEREDALVASFDPTPAGAPRGLLSFTELSQDDHAAALDYLKARKEAGTVTVVESTTTTTEYSVEIDEDDDFDAELEQWRLAEELAFENDES